MVSANASVTDVNRQSFASNLELLVHPSTLYVGIRKARGSSCAKASRSTSKRS